MYKCTSYYDLNQRGCEDSAYYASFTNAIEWAHGKLMDGNIILLANENTGASVIYTPDYYQINFDGDAYAFFKGVE